MARKRNRYAAIVETIFSRHYSPGQTSFGFAREEMVAVAEELGIPLPKNLGDVLYSFRFRAPLPDSIRRTEPEGEHWIIRLVRQGQYEFALVPRMEIIPGPMLTITKIPDATPGIVSKYAMTDEQALLAKVRYNRLIDIFTGLTCYSLQNHLRTTLPDGPQVETDEIYVGIDMQGVHYALTVQAKASSDRIGIVQIEQDFAVCASKLPELVPVPIAAQLTDVDVIALFAFEQTQHGIKIASEKHYQLVSPDDLTPEELAAYRTRTG